MKRIFLIVLDSFGIGEMPDAANYGDEGSNTLGTVAKSPEFSMPNMAGYTIPNGLQPLKMPPEIPVENHLERWASVSLRSVLRSPSVR